jgi:hypothetical protein
VIIESIGRREDAFVGEVGGVEEVGALDAQAEVTAECGRGEIGISNSAILQFLSSSFKRRNAMRLYGPPGPWVETHGYIQVVAARLETSSTIDPRR